MAITSIVYSQNTKQKNNDYKLSISGWISSETIHDTRQVVQAREGDVILYPTRENLDANGEDINATSSFNMFSIHSRFRIKVDGPEIFGAKSSALLETDFVGTSNALISMARLRHAILKLEWEKTTLMAGQFWHPFFVLSSYPQVSGWGGGLPYAILSRNPQIRLTYKLTENLTGSVTALTERDFASSGPEGTSPDYMRDAGQPEFNLHLEYKKNGWTTGFLVGYKKILPRKEDLQGLKLTKTLNSFQTNVYARKDIDNFTAKLQGLYGENMFNFIMLGGYAEFIDPDNNEISYSNYKTGSVWTELLYTKKRMTYSVFGGYSKNYGTDKTLTNETINRYARGTDIDYVYRIAPRLTYSIKKFLIMLEVSYNAAAYGTILNNGKVNSNDEVSSVRTQLHFLYKF